MGEIEKNIIDQCIRFGQPIPDRIANKPELLPGLIVYFDAFFDLSSDRRVSESGLGPIPWSLIMNYGLFYGFSEEQMDDLFYFIRGMDDAYLKRSAK